MKNQKLSATDLELNDWVTDGECNLQVVGLGILGGDIVEVMIPVMSHSTIYAENLVALSNGALPLSRLKPIKLTKEHFERLGWDCSDEGYYKYKINDNIWLDFYPYENRLRRWWEGFDEWQNHSKVKEITFTKNAIYSYHELQHVLRMIGLNDMANQVSI